ncbi:hypothetical protein CJU90_5701 [Yarrowia sp. C11]|nr:hypothetical protein CJU90_5701 [Yarrowia sp. C11]KAG5364285.1 hypothetical protein CKK34_3079 [Yarrowia sp. E02]
MVHLVTLVLQLSLALAAEHTTSAEPKYGTNPGQINRSLAGEIIDHNGYENAGVSMQNDPEYKSVRADLKTMASDNRDGIMTVRDEMLSLIGKYFSTVSGFNFYTSINSAWLVPGFDIHTLTTQFSDDPLPTPTTTLTTSVVTTTTGTAAETGSTGLGYLGNAQTGSAPPLINKNAANGVDYRAVYALLIPALLL